MQVKRSNTSTTEVTLSISAGENELRQIKEHVVKRLSRGVKLPGFRSGKAPQAVVEKNLDQNLLQGDFLDEAMTQLYAKATRDENLRPVTRPEVKLTKFVPFSELEFDVSTHVIGPLKLPDYKNVKSKKEVVKVTDKDVQDVIQNLQTRLSQKKAKDDAASGGDEVVIDFVGKDEKGQLIEGAQGNDYPLVIGSKAFIPGFEEKLVGVKQGEERTFIITFPKDYGVKALANKKVEFTVTTKTVNELVRPEINDELAAEVGPFKSLDELRKDIKKQLETERGREATAKQQNEILKSITDKSKVDIPKPLIDQQVNYNVDELKRNLSHQGQTYQEFLKQSGKTEETYRKELEPMASDQIKAGLVLGEIAERESLTVEPEELNLRIQHLKTHYQDPAMQAELDRPENRQDIASRMLNEKVLNLITAD